MVADYLTERGVPAERVPLSGSLGGKYSDDIVLGTIDHPEGRIECKNRESIGDYLWKWLETATYLVLKKNHKQMLVVIPIDEFIRLRNKK